MKTIARFFVVYLAACCTPPPAIAQNRARFVQALKAATTAQTSATLPNIGQVMHLLTVIFPGAAAAVSPIQVRLEASYDNSIWFPISPTITSAPRLGGITYQIVVAYGPYPFLRVRSLTAQAEPMDVWYSGQTEPAVSYVVETADRFLL